MTKGPKIGGGKASNSSGYCQGFGYKSEEAINKYQTLIFGFYTDS
jgi:hypothetical protein